MRRDINQLQNPGVEPGGPVSQAIPVDMGQAGGDDFLSRANQAIMQFKELIKLAMQLKQMSGQGSQLGGFQLGDQPAPGPDRSAAIDQFLAQYGSTKVVELLELLGPMTLNQVWGMINAARSRK